MRTTGTMHHHVDFSRRLSCVPNGLLKITSFNRHKGASLRLFAHQGHAPLSSPLNKELAVHAVANDSGCSASAVQAPTHSYGDCKSAAL